MRKKIKQENSKTERPTLALTKRAVKLRNNVNSLVGF